MSKFTEDSLVDSIEARYLDGSPATETEEAVPARWVVNVRRVDRVLRDGEVVSKRLHRHVIEPGDSLKDEDALVQRIARAVRR